MSVQDLLANGKNEEALTLCHEEMALASLHHNGIHDCYHRVISLFTRHGDFEAATSLCNRMGEEGFIVPAKTLMVLLRSMHTHDAKHVQQIQAMLTTGATQLDTLAFKTILDSMVLHNFSPEDLENALVTYSGVRGEGWIAPLSVYGTIIKAHALAGEWDRAEEWLEKYRKTIPLRNQKQDVASPAMVTKEVTTNPSNDPRDRLELGLQRQNEISPLTEDPNFPYAAVLMGYVKSLSPPPQRIEWLIERMRVDGITPDISMCNMLIAAFSRWGWSHRAYSLYRSMLAPNSASLPDAYTFRHIFIMLNPKRQRGRREIDLPEDISARQIFKEMIALDRLRLYPRKPQPHKNLISTATFNCALRTFTAQRDYAAAWTVLSCFTRHHVSPDRDTMRTVILGLLRRMREEIQQKDTMNDVTWVNRFLGERSAMTLIPSKRLLADRVFVIGRDAVTELESSRCETYLKPSLEIQGATEHALIFLVAILRVSLQASLGFSYPTQLKITADKAIKNAMLQARTDMIPRGRLHRN